MSNSVFLECLRIENSDRHVPHTGHCIQYYLIPPEVMAQQLPQVLLEGERWYPASLWIWHCLLYPVQGHQSGKLIPVYQLPVVHHVIHHHSSEIPIWEIGMVCAVSCPDHHTPFEGREQAVTHPIHLRIEEERTLMPNVTYQVTRKIVKTKRNDQSPHLP